MSNERQAASGSDATAVVRSREIIPAERSLHVLLAEDNLINQKLTLILLSKLGHTAAAANNGVEAVELFRRERFDIVLMDIQMPLMDGVEALEALRKVEQERGGGAVPVVAVTAYALGEDRQKFLDAGFDGYIAKPFKSSYLAEVLASLTSREPASGA